MINYLKHKNDEPNSLERFLDFASVVKRFHDTVNGSPDECAKRISDLSLQDSGWFNTLSRDVNLTEVIPQQIYQFEIRRMDIRRYVSAKAVGWVEVDRESEKTVIRGRVSIGTSIFGWLSAFLIFPLLTKLIPGMMIETWWPIIVIVGVFSMTLECRQLYALIQDTFFRIGTYPK